MNKVVAPHRTLGKRSVPLTGKERLRIAHRAFGTWKHPLKSSLRTLASIRRKLDRRGR